jgi:hypothetical protein
MSVTVAGRGGMGLSDFSAAARVGASGCAASAWRSDSGVVCRSGSGMRGGASVLVSIGVQRGSLSAAVSYDAPVVSSAGVSNVASSGAMSVSVCGRGMGASGPSAVGRVGGSASGGSVVDGNGVPVPVLEMVWPHSQPRCCRACSQTCKDRVDKLCLSSPMRRSKATIAQARQLM